MQVGSEGHWVDYESQYIDLLPIICNKLKLCLFKLYLKKISRDFYIKLRLRSKIDNIF